MWNKPPPRSCFLEPACGWMPGLPHYPLAAGRGGPTAICKSNWASRLRFCFLCPFWGNWRWWHMRLVSRVDLCLLQRWGHLPWGTGKSGQSMPNHPPILKYFGPRSHEIYSKTCGSNFFFLQNVILYVTWKKLASSGSCHESVQNSCSPKGYRFSPYCKFPWKLPWRQPDLALVKKLRT